MSPSDKSRNSLTGIVKVLLNTVKRRTKNEQDSLCLVVTV